MKKIFSVVLIAIMAFGLLAGCAKKTELTKSEQDLVAEYAAQMVLKHDKNYDGKLEEVTEAATEETTEVVTESGSKDVAENQGGNTPGHSDTGTDMNTGKSLSEAFGFNGLTVNYTAYQVVDSYPQVSDTAFVLTSPQDMKLLILKFNVLNETGADVNVQMMPVDTAIKAVLNENSKYNALITLLMDGLNTFSGIVKAGETKEMVLAFQIPSMEENAIEKLSLQVSKSGSTSIFDLK